MDLSDKGMTRDTLVLSFDSRWIRRAFVSLIIVECVLVAIYLIIHVIAPDVRWGPLSLLFDLDRDLSIPSWFSSIQLFVASAVLFAVSTATDKHVWFLRLGFLAILFASIDEGAAIHEKVTGAASLYEIDFLQMLMINDHGAWIAPYLLAGVLLIFASVRPILDIYKNHRRPSLLVIGGTLVFIIGAVGFEVVSFLFLLREHGGALYSLEVAAEEFFEMIGVTLVLCGIVTFGVEVENRYEWDAGDRTI